MTKTFAALLLALTLSACAGRAKPQFALDRDALPDFPAAPVDTTRSPGPELLPWLDCVSKNPWPQCRGPISPRPVKDAMRTAQK